MLPMVLKFEAIFCACVWETIVFSQFLGRNCLLDEV